MRNLLLRALVTLLVANALFAQTPLFAQKGSRAGPQPAPALLPGTPNDCVKYITATQAGDAGSTCGGTGTPVVFVGTTAGTANAQTVASPSPSGFTFTDGYVVVVKIGAALTNTSTATLNVSATGAKAVATQDGSGALLALVGGELAAGGTYAAVAHTSCPAPISADCYTIMTTPGNGAPITDNATITAAQFNSFTPVVISASGKTITTPVVTGLSKKGGIPISTIGNSITLQPNAADGVNGGTVGAPVTIPANAFTLVTTSGSSGINALSVPLSSGGGISCPASFTATNGECAWTQTVSGVSTVDFSGLTLNDYELIIDGSVQSLADTMLVRFGAATTNYINAIYYLQNGTTTLGTKTSATNGIDLDTGNTAGSNNVHLWIQNLRSGAADKTAHGTSLTYDGTNVFTQTVGGVYKGSSSDITAIHIVPNTGTETGTFTLKPKSR